MANPGNRKDPLPVFCFKVEISGVSAFFKSVSGLKFEMETIPQREGGQNYTTYQLIGATKWSNIVLKRGLTRDTSLWQWRKSIVDGNLDRRNGSIVMLDETHNPVLRWSFRNGWPCKLTGPCLDASSNEVAIETLEIAHEGLELEGA